MPVEIRVPQMGESVTEAVVGQWLKKEGDSVGPDEAIVTLETDKVAVEVPADQAGVLERIVAPEGANVAVGDVLATIGEGAGASPTPPTESAAAPAAPAAPAAAATTAPLAAGANGATAARDVAATPVAQRIAAANDLDVTRVPGSGRGGRVTKDDVSVFLQGAAATSAPAPGTPSAPPALQPQVAPGVASEQALPAPLAALLQPSEREERVRMSRRRETIARRLVEAQHTAAMLTTFNEVDMSAVMELRRRRRDAFKERHNVGLGFMSFFTRAVVGALKAFPRLNAEIQGNEFVLKRHYDIGIAVGAEEGLVVPVLRDADRKSFAEIEREIVDLATRARENKLTLAELQGGTFTITNGGTFGSLLSTPILNAPEVGILGMHKIEERPVVVKGEIVARPMMYLALSYDHRIVDGREAVQFLVRVKELIEDSETLLLEG